MIVRRQCPRCGHFMKSHRSIHWRCVGARLWHVVRLPLVGLVVLGVVAGVLLLSGDDDSEGNGATLDTSLAPTTTATEPDAPSETPAPLDTPAGTEMLDGEPTTELPATPDTETPTATDTATIAATNTATPEATLTDMLPPTETPQPATLTPMVSASETLLPGN